MLFDLRGGHRRRLVQAIYLTLAILMGGGLVLFGIGGNVSGGLIDAIQGGQTSTDDTFKKREASFERKVRLNPRDDRSWAELARTRFQLAGQGDGYDNEKGEFTAEGKRGLRSAATAWNRYLDLDPKKVDDGLASVMLQAFSPAGLDDPKEAARAARIVTEARPSSSAFSQLAFYSYQSGDDRTGDLAKRRAIELAPKDERAVVRERMAALEKEAKSAAAKPPASAPPSLNP